MSTHTLLHFGPSTSAHSPPLIYCNSTGRAMNIHSSSQPGTRKPRFYYTDSLTILFSTPTHTAHTGGLSQSHPGGPSQLGHTYQRAEVENWIETCRVKQQPLTSPVTKEEMVPMYFPTNMSSRRLGVSSSSSGRNGWRGKERRRGGSKEN